MKQAGQQKMPRSRRRGHVQRALVQARQVHDGVLYIAPRQMPGRVAGHTERAVAVIEVMGTNISLRSTEDQETFVAGYQTLLRAIPPQNSLQVLIRREKRDLSDYIRKLHAVAQDTSAHPTYRAIAAAHAAHVEQLGADRTLFDTRCYVIVPAQDDQQAALLTHLQRRRRHKARERSHDSLRTALNIHCERLLTHLSTTGLIAYRLNDEALVQLAASCLAPTRAERFPLTHATITGLTPQGLLPLPDLIAPSAVVEQPGYLMVEGDYLRSIVVAGYPREVTTGWLAPLLSHDDLLDISFHIHAQHPAMVLRRFRRRKAELRANKRLALRRGWVDDPDDAVAAGDIERLLAQVASREEALAEVGLYLQVRAPDLATLDERTERLMAVLKSLLLVAHPATFEQLHAWQAMQPLADDALWRTALLDSRSLATTFPFVSQTLSMPGGVLEGVTATGEPVLIDDWDDELDNAHRFIGAITGAGKSFYCKLKIMRELVVRYLEGLQIAVIDPEREYERLCHELDGTMVHLAPGSPQHLNPFDLIPQGISFAAYLADRTHGDRLAEKVQALHALYDLMLSDRGPTGVTTLSVREKGLLDRATYEVYRRAGITADPVTHNRPVPLLPDLYEVLRSGAAGIDDTGLADRLYRYVEGSLAGMFSAPTDVALDNRLVVFDIRAMSGELRPIGILLIADFIWTQVLAESRPRVLYIDEAWSLIQHPEGGRFLADLSRRARKHYLRLVTITQSPERFVDDPYGAVIAGNAATKILKKQDRTSAQAIASRFVLTAAERQKLLTLPKSEALLLTGGKRLVVTVEANPVENRLATTNPRELAQMAAQERDQNGEENG